MNIARRLALTVVVGALLTLVAFGVGWGVRPGGPLASAETPESRTPTSEPETGSPTTPTNQTPSEQESSVPTPAPPSEPEPSDEPSNEVPPDEPSDEPTLEAGPALLRAGAENDDVRDLQARLRQIEWFNTDVTGYYGDVTTDAVRGFQEKRGFPTTGDVDQRTLDRLHEMTTEPSADELANIVGLNSNTPGALDARCTTGRAVCVDKTTQTLRWVVDGAVLKTLDVRFGAEYTPTREGAFAVQSKSIDHVSTLFGSAMPYAMFFSGGQAVHYSSDFLAYGYAGASHGCVNVRDETGVAWLFDHVNVGDPVIVYRS